MAPTPLTSSGNSSPTRAMISEVFPTWARKEREDVGTGRVKPKGAAGQGPRQPRVEPGAGVYHAHGGRRGSSRRQRGRR